MLSNFFGKVSIKINRNIDVDDITLKLRKFINEMNEYYDNRIYTIKYLDVTHIEAPDYYTMHEFQIQVAGKGRVSVRSNLRYFLPYYKDYGYKYCTESSLNDIWDRLGNEHLKCNFLINYNFVDYCDENNMCYHGDIVFTYDYDKREYEYPYDKWKYDDIDLTPGMIYMLRRCYLGTDDFYRFYILKWYENEKEESNTTVSDELIDKIIRVADTIISYEDSHNTKRINFDELSKISDHITPYFDIDKDIFYQTYESYYYKIDVLYNILSNEHKLKLDNDYYATISIELDDYVMCMNKFKESYIMAYECFTLFMKHYNKMMDLEYGMTYPIKSRVDSNIPKIINNFITERVDK